MIRRSALKLLRCSIKPWHSQAAARRRPRRVGGLIGDSLPIQRLRMQIGQYGDSASPSFIEGESGSGKDVVAAAACIG